MWPYVEYVEYAAHRVAGYSRCVELLAAVGGGESGQTPHTHEQDFSKRATVCTTRKLPWSTLHSHHHPPPSLPFRSFLFFSLFSREFVVSECGQLCLPANQREVPTPRTKTHPRPTTACLLACLLAADADFRRAAIIHCTPARVEATPPPPFHRTPSCQQQAGTASDLTCCPYLAEGTLLKSLVHLRIPYTHTTPTPSRPTSSLPHSPTHSLSHGKENKKNIKKKNIKIYIHIYIARFQLIDYLEPLEIPVHPVPNCDRKEKKKTLLALKPDPPSPCASVRPARSSPPPAREK